MSDAIEIHSISKNSQVSAFSSGHRAMSRMRQSSIVATSMLALLMFGFERSTAQSANNQPATAYEVVSLKLSAPSASGAGLSSVKGNYLVIDNLSVQQMVHNAYDVVTDDLVLGMPSWATSARYDVRGRLLDTQRQETETNRLSNIERVLLKDRFNLKSHYEKQTRKAFALVSDPKGAKLQTSSVSEGREVSIRRCEIHLRSSDMALFIRGLSLTVGRPIVDHTGLKGTYNIDFKCAPDDAAGTADISGSVFTLLREQLGLQLKPVKTPVEVLVIDQLEKPILD